MATRPIKTAAPKDETPALSAEGLCAIIKACRQNQVQVMRFGQLELSFVGAEVPPTSPWPVAPRKVSAKGLEEISRKAVVTDEVSVREEYLDLLKIEDPAAYERFVMSEDSEKRDEED